MWNDEIGTFLLSWRHEAIMRLPDASSCSKSYDHWKLNIIYLCGRDSHGGVQVFKTQLGFQNPHFVIGVENSYLRRS